MNQIKLRGNNWYYQDLNSDKKEAILLVHGHPFNHTMWQYQYECLSGYRLILPDLKGYGKSDFQFDKIYIEGQALDLALLLDELRIEKIHLIGLSMGGQIIVEFCRLFSHRVLSLVICASTPTAESETTYKNRLDLAAHLSDVGMTTYTKNCIYQYINIEEFEEGSGVYEHLFEMMTRTPVIGAVASHRGRAERRDNMAYLRNINQPALVIAGEKDYFFKVEDIKNVAKNLPNATFKLISNSGHLPNMENPSEFNKLLQDFYKYI